MSSFKVILIFAALQGFGHADGLPWGAYKNFTIQQGSYVLHKDDVTWQQAKERCAGAGAELWVPADAGEQRAVLGELDIYRDWIWTGINDQDNTGAYRAPDGRPLSIDRDMWGAGEPNSQGGSYRCGAMWRDSSLYVYKCAWTAPYVCRIPAQKI